jgi:hypothetical protein
MPRPISGDNSGIRQAQQRPAQARRTETRNNDRQPRRVESRRAERRVTEPEQRQAQAARKDVASVRQQAQLNPTGALNEATQKLTPRAAAVLES